MAWYGNNSGGRTHPVGHKQANAFGLYDMHGNVKEWMLDAYRASYADQPTPTVSRRDRVVRGGSWADRAPFCRSAKRSRVPRDYRNFDLGFRVVAHMSLR
jgi:formylglycine-generating enzyme required for sulfatase activity